MELSNLTLEIFTTLEQKWLSNFPESASSKKAKLLTIDGGGPYSGPVSAAALLHLERQIQLKTGDPLARIPDFFDLVAGTGIGALYAALITADDGSGRPLFSASEAVSFVSDNRQLLFSPAKRRLPFLPRGGGGGRGQRFSGKSMERVLKAVLRRKTDGKVLTLRDSCKPLLVPCFDLNTSAPFVFSRAGALESPSFDFELWKVCRATSATPSAFKPFEISSVDGKTMCFAIDGGLVMNNPTAAAVTHVLHNKIDFPSVNGVEDLLVLSLGNGPSAAAASASAATGGRVGGVRTKNVDGNRNNNGVCSTAAVVDIVLDGVSETVDQLLGNAFCWNRTDYVRIQTNGVDGTDNALNEKGVESLPFGGKRLLTETNGQRIDTFVQRIVASARNSLPPSPMKSVSPLVDGR